MKYVAPLIALIILISGCFILLSNDGLMLSIAFVTDRDSKISQFAIRQVFKASKRKDLVQKYSEIIENGKRRDIEPLCMLVIGAVGDSRTFTSLASSYIRCQDNPSEPSCITDQYLSITSMGLLGDIQYAKFVDTILNNYEHHQTEVRAQIFARSLFLMTGNKPLYKNDDGVVRHFEPWDSIVKARKVILDTKNRPRTVDEMMILYNAV